VIFGAGVSPFRERADALISPTGDLLIEESETAIIALISGGNGMEEEPEGIRTGDDGFVDDRGEDVELGAAESFVNVIKLLSP